MAVTQQEPIISRLDRLDNLMRHLEEMKLEGGKLSNRNRGSSSPTPPTTPSTATSDGHASSFLAEFSPTSKHDHHSHPQPHCRPIDDVVLETEYKGTLLERVARIEDRLFKVCKQLEAGIGMPLPEEEEQKRRRSLNAYNNINKKKGFKELFKSCVKPKHKPN